MPKRIAIVLALLMMSAAGFAQVVPTGGNVYVGYALNRASTGWSNTGNLNGWEVSAEGKLAPFVGIVGDVGTQYGTLKLPAVHLFGGAGSLNSTTRVVSYLFGPRVSFSVGKFRPYAHALVGAAHLHESALEFHYGETALANAFGGGIDYSLIPLVAWRVQGDVLQTRFHSGRQEDTRISSGLVLKF